MPAPRITPADAVAAIERTLLSMRGESPRVTAATEVDQLGLDSLEIVEIFIVLEERTGCVVSTEALANVRVVGDVARLECLEIDGAP